MNIAAIIIQATFHKTC